MAPSLRRLAGVFALALGCLAVVPAPAALAAPTADPAAPTADPADSAAGWLARQLVGGNRFEDDFGGGLVYPDTSLTLDAVLAFAAAGTAGDNATAAMEWLATDDTALVDYVGDEVSFSDAGRLAKVAYLELVTGGDPTDVGGVDVLARLNSLLTPGGRFSDTPAEFDLSNAFGQSFALLALARTPAGVPATTVAFLAGSECAGGGFPLNFGEPTCTPDADATAMVVQALSVPGGDPAAAARGLDWLVSVQGADGSFSGTGPTASPNSNSTGLAAQALAAAGRTAPAAAAVGWLAARQSSCTAPVEERGAVAYDASGFDAGNAKRATAQAVLGLAGVGLAELTLTGAESSAPTLECAPGPSPSPSPTVSPSSSPSASPSASPSVSPTAVPTTIAPTTVAPTTVVPVAPTTSPAPVVPVTPPPTQPAAGELPDTGADVLPVVWAGTGLVLLGALAALAARRRTP